MSAKKTVYQILSAIDTKKDIKELQGANYLPWADAWNYVKKEYPLATYGIFQNTEGMPYFASEVGLFVKVWVKIEEEYQELFLPVLNSAHKTLKLQRYSYLVNEYVNRQRTGKMVEKWVEAVNSFDINAAQMRSLVKVLALMGLAINVYRDEAMPEEEKIDSSQIQQITNLCKTHNYQIASIAGEFGNYKGIADMPSAKFDDFIAWATPK